MNNQMVSQSFNVDDIRRIRDEAEVRYCGMKYEEIMHDIHERAKVGYQIIERLRSEKQGKRSE